MRWPRRSAVPFELMQATIGGGTVGCKLRSNRAYGAPDDRHGPGPGTEYNSGISRLVSRGITCEHMFDQMPMMIVGALLPRFQLTVAVGDRAEMLREPTALAPEPGGAQKVGEVSLA